MKTDITVLLDRSGSMSTIKADMEGGFADYLRRLREQPDAATVSLHQFDTDYETVYQGQQLALAPNLVLVPRGGTALVDSMVRCIDETGARLASLPPQERPDRVLMLVITDGEENSSTKHSSEELKAKIQHQTDVYKWEFIYLGANQDAFSVASIYGIRNAGTYQASRRGTAALFAAAADSTNNYRSGGLASVDQGALDAGGQP